MRGLLAYVLVVGACKFSGDPASTVSPGDDAGIDGAIDAPIDASTDAKPPGPRLHAAAGQMLYRINVDARQAMLVGPITDATGAIEVAGLAYDGTNLVGLTPNGVELVTIDPATALATAPVTLVPVDMWAGLTIIPATDTGGSGMLILVAAQGDGKLSSINPATGIVGSIGSFSGGVTFLSDLAWVRGKGVFAMLSSGPCAPACIARINLNDGKATPIRTDAPSDIFGLSGYRQELWALHSGGAISRVDTTTGALTPEFDPGIAWTDAAQ